MSISNFYINNLLGKSQTNTIEFSKFCGFIDKVAPLLLRIPESL
jgi:hypothetical protein